MATARTPKMTFQGILTTASVMIAGFALIFQVFDPMGQRDEIAQLKSKVAVLEEWKRNHEHQHDMKYLAKKAN